MEEKRSLILILGLAAFAIVAGFLFNYFNSYKIPQVDPETLFISKDLIFGVAINVENGNNSYIDVDSAKKEIDAARAMGTDLIRFDIGPGVLGRAEEMRKIMQLKTFVDSKNMKTCISLRGGDERDFESFKKAYLDSAAIATETFRPDYILFFPDHHSGVVLQAGPTQLGNFVKELALSTKKKSFDTKVVIEGNFGLSAPEEEVDFLRRIIEDNDPVIDIVSMEVRNAEDLEAGRKNLSALADRYHWHGGLWMGDIKCAGGQSAAGQKDFLLYSIHLANAGKFEGVIISDFRDAEGNGGGILTEDFRYKYAYEAIKTAMASRR